LASDTPTSKDGHVTTDSPSEVTKVDSPVDSGAGPAQMEEVSPEFNDDALENTRLNNEPDEEYPFGADVKSRRRWPWVVAFILMAGVAATAAAVTYQMVQRTDAWSKQVDAATEISYGLGDTLADAQSENTRLSDEISLVQEQLANSKDTVLKLSDEKAQWRDDTEFAKQQVEATEQLLTTATAVANGLQRCTDGQQELMDFIDTATEAPAPPAAPGAPTDEAVTATYTAEEIAAYRTSVNELCDNAETANIDLQKALTE